MSILDGASFWRNTLVPQLGNGQAAAKRVPFAFTSTLRLLKSGNLKAVNPSGQKQQAATDQRRVLAQIERDGRGASMLNFVGVSDIGTVLESVTRSVLGSDMSVINMAVNPQTITWSQDKRVSKRDTMQGSVFFHFTNAASQNNDILRLSFTGKTGNINVNTANNVSNAFVNQQGGQVSTATNGILNLPINTATSPIAAAITGQPALASNPGQIAQSIAYEQAETMKSANGLKLRTWHELYNLTREPVLLTPDNTGIKDLPNGIKNEFYISYRTALFPTQVVFIGFFDKVLDFTESAQDPFNRDFSFSFTVTNSSPSLDDISKKISSNLALVDSVKAAIK